MTAHFVTSGANLMVKIDKLGDITSIIPFISILRPFEITNIWAVKHHVEKTLIQLY
jgi:hypothetical protein